MSDYSFFKNCPYTSPFHSHKYIIRSKFFTILSFAHLENGHSLFFVCLFAFSLIGHSLFIGVLIPRLLLIQFALGCQIPKTQFDHSSLCSRIINGSFLFAVFCSNFFLNCRPFCSNGCPVCTTVRSRATMIKVRSGNVTGLLLLGSQRGIPVECL